MKRLGLLLGLACAAASQAAPLPEAKGMMYTFSAAQWNLFNGGPLSYTPFELGWAFGNGLRVQSGIDIFYYRGRQADELNYKGLGPRQFSYEMTDWRSSLVYRVPLPLRLRPVIGLSLDAVGGKRRRTPEAGEVVSATEQARDLEAWNFFGGSALAGLEFLLNQDWSLGLTGRYLFTFNDIPSPSVVALGINVVF